jgi:hypothetical protein
MVFGHAHPCELGRIRTMQTFEEIVDNGLTSIEEVQLEHNAREGAIWYTFVLALSDLNTALTAPQVFLDGEVSGN